MKYYKRTKSVIITTKTCAKDLAVIAEYFKKQGITFKSAYEFMDTIVAEYAKAVKATDPTLTDRSLIEATKALQDYGVKNIHQGKHGKSTFLKALKIEHEENTKDKLELDSLGTVEIIEEKENVR